MGKKLIPLLAIFCAALLHHSVLANALEQEPYYKGKTVRFLINFSAGGPTDVFGRLIARYFSKHVAGNPAVVVQKMSGAGGIIGANYVYEIAKPDGLTVGVFSGMYLPQILGGAGLVTTRAQLAKSPDVSRRVVKSFVEGIHLAMTNAEVSKQAFRRYIRLQQDREQEESLQVLRSFLPRKPYPTIEGFKAVLAELAEQIPAARTADAKDFIDTRFLEELDRSGYIDGLYR